MTKVILASLIAFGAVAANAGSVCNPEQEACSIGNPRPNDGVGYTPVKSEFCNPEQDACVTFTTYNGTPQWMIDLEKWAVAHGFERTDAFAEKGN